MRTWHVTRRGWWFILAVVMVTIPSYAMSHSLLFLLTGFFLAIALYNALYVFFNLRGVRVSSRVVGEWVAGSDAIITVRIQFARGVRRDLEVVGESDNAHIAPERLERVSPGTETRLRVSQLWRGRTRIQTVYVESSYPFGFFALRVSDDALHEPLVMPWTFPANETSLTATSTGGGFVPVTSGDYQYLDDYRHGEDVRFVHWKKSAARGELVVRRDVRRRSKSRTRVFVPDPCPYFEFAICSVASEIEGNEEEWSVWDGNALKHGADGVDLRLVLAELEPCRPPGQELLKTPHFEWVFASDVVPDAARMEAFERAFRQSVAYGVDLQAVDDEPRSSD